MKVEFDKKIYTSLISFIGLSFVLILFVIFTLIKKIKENSQQLLLEKETRLSFLEQKEDLRNFKDIYQEIEPDLEKTENLFISSGIPIDFINFLEKTASDSNTLVEISSVTLVDSKDDSWSSLEFRLQVFASFSNFSRFIERLENDSYLIEIYDLNIKKLSDSNLKSEKLAGFSTGDVAVSLSLKVFTK